MVLFSQIDSWITLLQDRAFVLLTQLIGRIGRQVIITHCLVQSCNESIIVKFRCGCSKFLGFIATCGIGSAKVIDKALAIIVNVKIQGGLPLGRSLCRKCTNSLLRIDFAILQFILSFISAKLIKKLKLTTLLQQIYNKNL